MAEKSREWSYTYPDESRIIKQGYLKKLKNKSISKKRYFVIWSEESSEITKMGYFDSEKKFRNKSDPNKPPIILKNCFNINKMTDTKHKFAIALYTDDDCLCLVTESEEEQEEWLNLLWQLHCGPSEDGEPVKPQFEHVWQVTVPKKGLGGNKITPGPYRLCLTDKNLSLVKINRTAPTYLFQLQSVRRYGHSNCYFHLEVGRHAVTGPGELWMHAEDAVIAQNVHETILHAMKNLSEPPPQMRQRSSTSMRTRTTSAASVIRTRAYSESKTNKPPSGDTLTMRPGSRSPVNNSPRTVPSLHTASLSDFRTRSDSLDSRGGTSSSVSTGDECEASTQMSHARTKTPEHVSRPSAPIKIPTLTENPSAYMDMEITNSNKFDNYMDMSPVPSASPGTPVNTAVDDPYMSMTPTSMSSSPAVSTKSSISEDAAYLDMGVMAYTLPTLQEKQGYMDMKPGSSPSLGTSPQLTGALRPNKVHSYLMENDTEIPKRHYSVGSRPNSKLSLKNKSYMDAITKQGMLDAAKSCSAPHLIPQNISPVTALSSLDNVQEHFMEMEFSRPRTGSDVGQMMRPRTASWTQFHRPRAASHGQKTRENLLLHERQKSVGSSNRSSQESLKSQDSRKLSSESLSKEGYMDMNFQHSRSNSQPIRQGSAASGVTDYMCMSPGMRNEKVGTGTSKTGDYVPMNPPHGSVKVTPVDMSSSPRHKTDNYMDMIPSDIIQARRSSVGASSRKVPVFKLTSAISSDSDSSTSGCHSSHSDLTCPSPNFGQSSTKSCVDSNGRGSLSQSSETDESGTYMNLSYDAKSESKNKDIKKLTSDIPESKNNEVKAPTSDIPDSYMPITYNVKKKDVSQTSTDAISTENVSSKSKSKKIKAADTSLLADSYMTFVPGADVSTAQEKLVTNPQKGVSYIRSQPHMTDDKKEVPVKKDLPPKKPTRKKSKQKLIVDCDGDSSSNYAMMSVGNLESTKQTSRKSDIGNPEAMVIKKQGPSSPIVKVPSSPLSPLSISIFPTSGIPRRSSSSQLSDGETNSVRPRRSLTEPLSSPSRSASSRHSSGTSTSTCEPDSSLNYASLDLGESSSTPKSPRKALVSESSDTDSPLMYSQIDFVKSDALKAEPPKLRENRTSYNDLKK